MSRPHPRSARRAAALIALSGLVVASALALEGTTSTAPAIADQGNDDEPLTLSAASIDAALEAAFPVGIRASKPASDAELVRRIYLDVTGSIPSPEQAAAFIWDDAPDKRDALIETLLASPEHAAHQADRITALLLDVEGTDEALLRFYRPPFRAWIREHLAADRPWDELVAAMLAAEGRSDRNPATVYLFRRGQPTPEDVAGSAARQLLGLQLECARCHDHPFDRWSQREFHGLAAWFARLRARPVPGRQGVFTISEAPVGDHRASVGGMGATSKSVIAPALPGGADADWRPGADAPEGTVKNSRRAALARKLTSPDNPWFARAAVNRVWAWYLGRGLVEPIDDLSAAEDGPHPQLLADLATAFAEGGFQFRALERAILRSNAYQRSMRPARGVEPGEARAAFASAIIRPLRAADAVASILRAAGREVPAEGEPEFLWRSMRDRLVAEVRRALPPPRTGELPDPDRVTTAEGLFILNGQGPAALASARKGGALDAILAAQRTDPDRVRALYARTLIRPPSEAELRASVRHVRAGGRQNTDATDAEVRRRYEDLFWALLATTEFLTNH